VGAMSRLARKSWEEQWPSICPVLNIHDDLTFIMDEEEYDEALDEVVREMLWPAYSWITVPISVEVEVGEDWGNQEEVGEFFSDDYYDHG